MQKLPCATRVKPSYSFDSPNLTNLSKLIYLFFYFCIDFKLDRIGEAQFLGVPGSTWALKGVSCVNADDDVDGSHQSGL
jgi:hypothetical protein